MTNTEEILLKQSGGSPLLSLDALSKILDRSSEGLRVSLTSNSELSQRLRKARCRLGRRVYFRITGENGIAAIIDGLPE
jgi:hypothetical protein